MISLRVHDGQRSVFAAVQSGQRWIARLTSVWILAVTVCGSTWTAAVGSRAVLDGLTKGDIYADHSD